MDKDTLTKLSYRELMELYQAVRDELSRRNSETATTLSEKAYGTD